MAKLFTYVIISIGLMILFKMAGLNTAGSIVLETVGMDISNPMGFLVGALFTSLLVAALGSLTVVGVVMGITGRNFSDVPVTALWSAPLVGLVADMGSIMLFSGTGWIGMVVILIMMPLIGGYIIALYDWIRGRD